MDLRLSSWLREAAVLCIQYLAVMFAFLLWGVMYVILAAAGHEYWLLTTVLFLCGLITAWYCWKVVGSWFAEPITASHYRELGSNVRHQSLFQPEWSAVVPISLTGEVHHFSTTTTATVFAAVLTATTLCTHESILSRTVTPEDFPVAALTP